MTGARVRFPSGFRSRLALPLATAMFLAGCGEEGFLSNLGDGGDGEGGGLPVLAGADAAGVEERDVEAPDIFSVREPGLWDGRPSLGGVWVAHPDVDQPERVLISNPANGTSVVGALFRRERDNPGPALQVSSDAAQELQMLAGAPAELNVVALRREEVAAPAPAEEALTPVSDADVETIAAPGEIEATALDPIAGAAAAIEAAEAEAPAAPPPAPTPAPAATSNLDRPYIQLGIFSVEDNATNTASQMAGRGLRAEVLRQESQGRVFWRVIVGPAATSAERARLLEQVQAAGFEDAYFVRN